MTTVEPASDAAAQILTTATRVCLFAHYHHLGLAAGYMLHYLDALRAAGFATVVISTADLAPAEADKIRARCATLIVRDNEGLDFGGWAEALRRYPGMAPDLLLLTNDSVYGPITDLAAFIDRLTDTPADFYGAVGSLQFAPHVQSWFVLLRPAAYRSAAFRKLMGEQPAAGAARLDIITDYEVGLSQVLLGEGLRYHSAFSPSEHGRLGSRWPFNPLQLLWRSLIERHGVPFLKVELLRSNPSGVDTRDALDVVERRNHALAALIRDDMRERAFTPPRPSRFYWVRSQERLIRDAELPRASRASWRNGLAFRFWWAVVRGMQGLTSLVRAGASRPPTKG